AGRRRQAPQRLERLWLMTDRSLPPTAPEYPRKRTTSQSVDQLADQRFRGGLPFLPQMSSGRHSRKVPAEDFADQNTAYTGCLNATATARDRERVYGSLLTRAKSPPFEPKCADCASPPIPRTGAAVTPLTTQPLALS